MKRRRGGGRRGAGGVVSGVHIQAYVRFLSYVHDATANDHGEVRKS